jgi:hypothetical protein
MKKFDVKKIIKKKIDFVQKNKIDKPILTKNIEIQTNKKIEMQQEFRDTEPKKYNKQDKAFVAGNPNFTNTVGYLEHDREEYVKTYRLKYELLKSGGYIKMSDVDYDVIICISSNNRYDKVTRLLDQFFSQKSKYSFKIVFLDDASIDPQYKNIEKNYPQLDYYCNTKNNGRDLYWYTVTQLWQNMKIYKSNTVLMIDDDFIICNNFLNILNDFFFYVKTENNNVVAIAPHLHSYSMNFKFRDWWYNQYSVDGISLFDRKFLESFDYRLQPVSVEQLNSERHAHGWSQIQNKILIEDKMAYKTKYSIAFHDGNDESILGKGNNKKAKAYTYNYMKDGVDYKDLMV